MCLLIKNPMGKVIRRVIIRVDKINVVSTHQEKKKLEKVLICVATARKNAVESH